MIATRTPDQVLGELLSLPPQGWVWAWMADPESGYAALLSGLAQATAQTEADAATLFAQIDPRVAVALLPDWEALLGLPDPCAGDAPTLVDRQAQAYARLTDQGGASSAYFTAFAAALGYTVEISTFRPFRCGDRCGGRLYGTPWLFAWLATVTDGRLDLDVLKCELVERAQAHTVVLFTDVRQGFGTISFGETGF